ncbi:MAG TPA: type II toxin-antitoxin system VapC family toxin [Firmicutes bacterium]|jgi:hypothetical protein|nr:type II toxin-antitoxin system VapC family toxin [Bacillota bacterium]
MKMLSNSNGKDNTSWCDDSPCIMDASALITYFEGKPRGAVIQRILEQSQSCGSKIRISALDMLMVYLKGITDHPDSFADFLALLEQIPIHVEPVTAECALETAKLMAKHQGLEPNGGISTYFAERLGGTMITADPVICKAKILPGQAIVYVGDDPPMQANDGL